MAEDTSGDIVLCEPAQSKRTWTFHKSKFVWNFTGKMLDTYPRASVFCEPVLSKCTWTLHKSHFVWKIIRKMVNTYPGACVLCEPAQSNCTWAFDKRHFVWIFTGKMSDATPGASVLCEPAQSKCKWTCHKSNFVWTIYRENVRRFRYHLDWTLTVRTPSVWPHFFGKKSFYTQTVSNENYSTDRGFCIQTLLHAEAFTGRRFYIVHFPELLLHADALTWHTGTCARRGFYRQPCTEKPTFLQKLP